MKTLFTLPLLLLSGAAFGQYFLEVNPKQDLTQHQFESTEAMILSDEEDHVDVLNGIRKQTLTQEEKDNFLWDSVVLQKEQFVEDLLSAGANPNMKKICYLDDNHQLQMPLIHSAAASGNLAIVKLLVNAGANVFSTMPNLDDRETELYAHDMALRMRHNFYDRETELYAHDMALRMRHNDVFSYLLSSLLSQVNSDNE